MTPTNCINCAQEIISDQHKFCANCGTPLELSGAPVNEHVAPELAVSCTTHQQNLSDHVDHVIKTGEDLKNKVLTSFAAIQEKIKDKLNDDADNTSSEVLVTEDINCEKFKSVLDSTITAKIAEVMKSKPGTEKSLSYFDAQILSTTIENIFKSALTICPPQIKAACELSSAILAPSMQEKQKAVRGAIGIAGGAAGMGMVISAIGAALGWGAGLIATVTAAFAGTSLTGPIGWGISGLALAGIAGYFAFSGGAQKDSERYIKVLKQSTAKAVNALWADQGEILTAYLEQQTGREFHKPVSSIT